jgi:hypothetical protein
MVQVPGEAIRRRWVAKAVPRWRCCVAPPHPAAAPAAASPTPTPPTPAARETRSRSPSRSRGSRRWRPWSTLMVITLRSPIPLPGRASLWSRCAAAITTRTAATPNSRLAWTSARTRLIVAAGAGALASSLSRARSAVARTSGRALRNAGRSRHLDARTQFISACVGNASPSLVPAQSLRGPCAPSSHVVVVGLRLAR